MIDLGHGYIGGDTFDKYINLKIPYFNNKELRDYSLPGGDIELLNMLVEKFSIPSKSNITLTLSTNLTFNIILNRILSKGKKIHLTRPTFSCFISQLDGYGGDVVEYYDTDIGKMILKAKKGDLILLVNPSNPTGEYLNEKEITNLMYKSSRNGVKMLIDVTWICTVYDSNCHLEKLETIIKLAIKYNHIVMFGLSKLLFSPGIRVSCAFGNFNDINHIKRSHDMLAISCSYFDQHFIKENLNQKNVIDYEGINEVLYGNYKAIEKKIENSELLEISTKPVAGIFVVLKSKKDVDFLRMTEMTKVITYPIGIFGGTGNSFRICIAKDIKIILLGIDKLLRYLEEIN